MFVHFLAQEGQVSFSFSGEICALRNCVAGHVKIDAFVRKRV